MTVSRYRLNAWLPGRSFTRAVLALSAVGALLIGCTWALNDSPGTTELRVTLPPQQDTIGALQVTEDTELFVHIIEADRFEALYADADVLFPGGDGFPPQKRLRGDQLGISRDGYLSAREAGVFQSSRFAWFFGRGAQDGISVTFRDLKPKTEYILYAIQGERNPDEAPEENQFQIEQTYYGVPEDDGDQILLELKSRENRTVTLGLEIADVGFGDYQTFFEQFGAVPLEPPLPPALPLEGVFPFYAVTVQGTVTVEGYDPFELDMHEFAQVSGGEGYYFLGFYGDSDFTLTNFSYVDFFDEPDSIEPSLETYIIPETFEYGTEVPGSLWSIYLEDDEQEIFVLIEPELYDPADPEGPGLEFELLSMGFQAGIPPSQGGTLSIVFFGEAMAAPFDEVEYRDVEIQWEITFGEGVDIDGSEPEIQLNTFAPSLGFEGGSALYELTAIVLDSTTEAPIEDAEVIFEILDSDPFFFFSEPENVTTTESTDENGVATVILSYAVNGSPPSDVEIRVTTPGAVPDEGIVELEFE